VTETHRHVHNHATEADRHAALAITTQHTNQTPTPTHPHTRTFTRMYGSTSRRPRPPVLLPACSGMEATRALVSSLGPVPAAQTQRLCVWGGGGGESVCIRCVCVVGGGDLGGRVWCVCV
jgi:hypothetical protein